MQYRWAFIFFAVFYVEAGFALDFSQWKVEPFAVPELTQIKYPRLNSTDDLMLLSWVEQNDDQSLLRYSVFHDQQWSPISTAASGNNWFVNYADFAQVWALDSQHFVAVWLERTGHSRFEYRFAVKQSFDAGGHWSEPVYAVDLETRGEHGFVSLAKFNETLIINWISGADDHYQLKTARLDENGEFDVIHTLDETSCSCCHPQMVATQHQVFTAYRDRTRDEIRDIAIIAQSDDAISEPQIVAQDDWEIAGCPVNGPALALAENRLAAFWFTLAGDVPKVRLATGNISKAGQTIQWQSQTIETKTALGYVDLQWLDAQNIALLWMSEATGEPKLRLQAVRANSLQLAGSPLSIDEAVGYGFPTLVWFKKQLYVFAASAENGLLALKVSP